MELDVVIESIKAFPGITRKNAIHEIVNQLPVDSFKQVFASKGEDAAAIEHGDEFILFATDGIMESLVASNPYLAGYFAVLVNISDIAAMGGKPMAMVDVMSLSKSKVCNQILRGMGDAVEKFNVPIVGGHTHPDCKYNAIDISIIGTVPKSDIILSSTANVGDDIVFVFDLDGTYPEGLKFAWDTTTKKSAEAVQAQIAMMAEVAKRNLVHSGKDMSNPGCIGTLGMMLESSIKGGVVDLERIPIPDGIDMVQWALSYQGYGFVFACDPRNSKELIGCFEEVGCKGAVVGTIDDSLELKLKYRGASKVLFDFKNEIITGCFVKR